MAETLTLQQSQAVSDRGGDLLVSAAAGSGKTKVLVERLMSYITDPVEPANIDDFLIITYTKAAASELRSKIGKALSKRIAQEPGNFHLQQQFQRLYLAKISTVHAFCTDILREYAYMLEIPGDFRMIEEQEDEPLRRQVLESVLTDAYNRISEDPDMAAFVDTQGVGRNDQIVPELILKAYDSAKCHMDSDGWLQKCVDDAIVSEVEDPSETVWGKYLMDRLFHIIDLNCQMLERGAALCDCADGLGKMGAILRDIHAQLGVLRSASTWQEIHMSRELDYGNVRGIGQKKNVDKDVYQKTKTIRDLCSSEMEGVLKDFGNDSAQVMSDLRQILPGVRGLVSLVRQFDQRYDRVKRGMRVMDFSDLEHKALDLLLGKSRTGITSAARQIGQRFRQIMVDEYQDSNEVQDAIFRALTEGRNNLFMVGDVKQSIYQFRLADPGIFLDKYNRFSSVEQARPGDGRKIILSNNFRSGGGVIEAVNSVFGLCMRQNVGGLDYGEAETLREGIPHEPLPEPETELHVLNVASDTYAEEADFVAGRIQELLDGTHMIRGEDGLRPIRPEDIVILLRSPKTSGWDFHYALQKRGIQTVSSHALNLLECAEVDWLRSFLQTINNPRQDIPLIAAMTGPVFGFGADDLAAVRISGRRCSFYDALCKCELPKARDFLETLQSLREYSRMHTLPELMERIFLLTGADSVYAAMVDGEDRSRNLRDFYQFVVRFSSAPGADLQGLLEYLQHSEGKGLTVSRQPLSTGCVQITSIHKSKGLEYPVVFLCGLSRLFNMRSVSGTLLCDPALGLGLSCVDNITRIRYPSIANLAISRKLRADSISEELRVLYVAMTRPKDRLIMTFAQSHMDEKLRQLAIRMDLSPKELITGRASCLGSWVLYSALQRTEAGSLFAYGVKPENTRVSQMPWRIEFQNCKPLDMDVPVGELIEEVPVEPQILDNIQTALSFCYPHRIATTVPSKQTATQRKGRPKDTEAAENAPAEKYATRYWRGLDSSQQTPRATEYGNAVHAAMQHVDLSRCVNGDGMGEELFRLVQAGFLSVDQAAMIEPDLLAAFFRTPVGRKVCTAGHVLREFKFSILDQADRYAVGITDEKVLLQGVVDCAIVEDDGITVVDLKTDHVTEETLVQRAEGYRVQVETYADALERIFELPVKEKLLYFVQLSRFYRM